VILCFAKLQAQDEITWTSNQKLKWSDFKGDMPAGSSAAATTASGISYDFSTFYKNDKLKTNFKVSTFFYPSKSWYNSNFASEWILAHEQLHFDITELYARKMREELRTFKFTKNVKAEVREIYKKTLRQLNDFQNKYDGETDYSRKKLVQERWIMEIGKALKE